MASEYAKLKAVSKRLKETKRPNVDFGLADPVNYVQNIKNQYVSTTPPSNNTSLPMRNRPWCEKPNISRFAT